MQWVNTLIGLGKKTNLHLQRMGALVYGLGADEPTCTPPGDTTESDHT